MEKIIEKVVKGDIDKNVLMEYLIDDFDCEKIYDSDEELITDAFFTLKHYASGEEEVSKDEWMYFLECLAGEREYNIETKNIIRHVVELFKDMNEEELALRYGQIEKKQNDFGKKKPTKVIKVGRNDPCPCGSGKKYKKCCGRNA